MSRPAGCYDAQRNTQHVNEAILSTKDHISQRVVCAVVLIGMHSTLAAIDRSTDCASEASCGRDPARWAGPQSSLVGISFSGITRCVSPSSCGDLHVASLLKVFSPERAALSLSLLYLMSVFFITRLLFMIRTSISTLSFTRMLI